MKQSLVQISVGQTSKVIAIIYGLIGLIFVPLFVIIALIQSDFKLDLLLILILPGIYAVFAYLFTAAGCWLYNHVAGWVGGIEFTIEKILLDKEIKCPNCGADLMLNEKERTERRFTCGSCKEMVKVKD